MSAVISQLQSAYDLSNPGKSLTTKSTWQSSPTGLCTQVNSPSTIAIQETCVSSWTVSTHVRIPGWSHRCAARASAVERRARLAPRGGAKLQCCARECSRDGQGRNRKCLGELALRWRAAAAAALQGTRRDECPPGPVPCSASRPRRRALRAAPARDVLCRVVRGITRA